MRLMNLWAATRDHINLWIDDERPAPWGWYQATTVQDAKYALEDYVVKNWSLDHDLGFGGEVYDLLKWMVEEDQVYGIHLWPMNEPTIHTQNPVGRENMKAILTRYAPYGEFTRPY